MQFELVIPIDEAAAELDAIRAQFRSGFPAAAQAIAGRCLALARDEFTALSAGQTLADGRSWPPLARSTVAARVYAGPGQSLVKQRQVIAQQIAAVRGQEAARRKADLEAQRQDLESQLQSMIDSEMHSAPIGHVTGSLEDSLTVQEVSATTVLISFDDPDAGFFQADRPLFPRKPIPRNWIEAASQAGSEALEKTFRQES